MKATIKTKGKTRQQKLNEKALELGITLVDIKQHFKKNKYIELEKSKREYPVVRTSQIKPQLVNQIVDTKKRVITVSKETYQAVLGLVQYGWTIKIHETHALIPSESYRIVSKDFIYTDKGSK